LLERTYNDDENVNLSKDPISQIPSKLLSRKFDFFVEIGRSPDLRLAIGLPRSFPVTMKVITSLIAYSCGNSFGLSPNSLLIHSIKIK
jgi:hypothetical protein